MAYKVLDSLRVEVPENAKFLEWSDNVSSWSWHSSDGDPNGVITATQGSLCMDRTNSTLYKKTTASGNTGWVTFDDTNFTRGNNLPALADRNFDFGGYDLNINSLDGLYFGNDGTGTSKTVGFGFEKMYLQNAGNLFDGARFQLRESVLSGANGGENYIELTVPDAVTASYAMQLPADQGADGRFLGISGGGGTAALTLAWQDDNTITTGTLAPATDSTRTVPMNFKNLTFDNVSAWVTNASNVEVNATIIEHHAALHQFYSSEGATGTSLLLMEGSDTGANFRGWKAPNVIADSYVLELPSAEPTSGQVLQAASGIGTSTVVMQWTNTGGGDSSIQAGVMADCVENRVADFQTFDLTMTNADSMSFSANVGMYLDAPGVVIRNTDPAKGGVWQIREASNSGTDYIAIKAPAAISATYNLTLPTGTGATGDMLKIVGGGGTAALSLEWSDDISLTYGVMPPAVNDRVANLNGWDLNFDSVDRFEVNATTVTQFTTPAHTIINTLTTAGGRIQMREGTANGGNNVAITVPAGPLAASYTVVLPPAVASSTTQYLRASTINGSVVSLDWDTPAGGSDNYFTSTTTMPTASNGTDVNMGTNPISFNDVTSFNVNSSALNTFTGSVAGRFFNANTALSGAIQLFQASAQGSNYVQFAPPTTLANTQSYVLPNALPGGASGYYLHCDNGGVWSWQVPPDTDTDTNYYTTGNNLPSATVSCTIPMNNQSLTVTEATSFVVRTAASDVYSGDGLNLYTRTNSSGLFVAENRRLYFANGAGDNVALKAPDTITTSGQTYTLPSAFPSGGNQVLNCTTGGAMFWDDDATGGGAGDNFYLTGNNLPTAAVPISADFGSQTLDFQNISAYTTTATTSTRLNTRTFIVDHLDSATGGRISLEDGNSGDPKYATISAPGSAMTLSYTLILPSDAGADGQLLGIASGGGTSTVTLDWLTDANSGGDNYYLTGTVGGSNNLPAATETVNVDFGINVVNFDQISTFNIDSNSTIWRNQGGATELGRLDTSGLKLGEAQYLSFKAVGGTETTFTSHASPTTASYTLPPGLPGANSILQSDSGGNLTWVVDQVGVGGSERQKDADDLGASGTSLSINFDSGSYDNKRVTFDANCSVDVTATRSTRYTLYCEATGSRRQITWTIGDNDLPLWVDPSNPVTISMEYAPETGWHVHETECDTVQILAATIEAATSNGGSYTLDCGNTYRNFEIVGDINRTSLTWNEFDNLPSQSVCVVGFSSGQTNTPLISGGFMKTGGDPTHAGRAIWTVLNAPGLGQVICARDEV